MTDSFNQPGFLNFVVANYSGARPWIADFSGLPIETQEWSGQRFVKVWISGQAVTTTVNVDLSGASFASNVSGNTVYLTSGQNAVQMSGQTVYLASGFNLIQGSFTADISGQPVTVSGNAVRISGSAVVISGQTVQIAGGVSVSGNVVVVPSTSVSGNAVRISGETVQIAGGINVSGSPVRISGETIYPVSGNAYMFGFDQSGATWNEVFMDTSGGHRIKVAISGDTVQIAGGVSVSGNAVRISGETVQIAGGVSVSGNMVSISGQAVSVSGNMVTVSGNAVRVSGETVIVPSTSVSGNAVSVSGNAVAISGQVIYPVSGKAYDQVFDPSGAQYLDFWSDASGSHRVLVATSGQTVLTSVSGNMVSVSGQVVNVSGNIVNTSGQVAIISGQPVLISGQLVAVSGTVAASVSGNMVSISGQPVSISGQTVVTSVSGIALNISGNTVYLVSGQNPVQLYALDQSGQELRPLIVNASGSNILRVDAGSIQVSANVSGNVVYLTSGQNNVQISGQNVGIVSGTAINALILDGQDGSNKLASVQDAVVTIGTGDQSLLTIDHLYGYTREFNNWTAIHVTQSGHAISGLVNKLIVGFSGDSATISGNVVQISGQLVAVSGLVLTSVSGNMVSVSGQAIRVSGNMVSVSGQAVTVSGNVVLVSGQLVAVSGLVATSVSGNMVTISGQVVTVSGNVVNTSGQVNFDFGTTLRTTSGTIVTSLSGGTELGSGIVINVTIRNLSGNNPMYIGGASGTGHEPFSGKGMILFGNESQTFEIDNFNKVRLFANTSGQRARCIGVGI